MKTLTFVCVYLLFNSVVGQESGVCTGVGDQPCKHFPLSLLDWHDNANEIDSDTSDPDYTKIIKDGKSHSLIERILLFPVCSLDESQCNKYAQSEDEKWSVFKMCQNSDETCILEYTIETGWQTLNDIIKSIHQANSLAAPNYLQSMYDIFTNTLSALLSVLSIVKTSLFAMAESVEKFIVPDLGLWDTVTAIQSLLRSITWSMIRYAIVVIIAVSLFPSTKQIRKFKMKAIIASKHLYGQSKEQNRRSRKVQSSLSPTEIAAGNSGLLGALTAIGCSRPQFTGDEQMLEEHFPMCEYFDNQKCNCDGRPCERAEEHYKMCEFYDALSCNCGGVKKTTCSAAPSMSMDISPRRKSEPGLLGSESNPCSEAAAFPNQAVEEIKYVQSPVSGERLPQWVQMAVGGVHVPDTKLLACLGRTRYNDGNTETGRLEQLPYSDSSPDESDEIRSLNEESIKNSSVTTKANLENISFKKVQYDKEIPLLGREEEHKEENNSPKLDEVSLNMDFAKDSFLKNLSNRRTSDIGSPYLNSSFKEDSPYVTANNVPYEDLMNRGDGAVFSTLTRRSPYVEEGLGDLSTDMSFGDSEGRILDSSILDVSDLNSSVSFSTGEGVVEVATLFALQTFWRIVKRVWQASKSEWRGINDVAIQEKEGGLYVIRQKNKTKGFRSPIRRPHTQKLEIIRGQDDNNNSTTETLMYYEVTNNSNNCECLKPLTVTNISKPRANKTLNKWIEFCRQSQDASKISTHGVNSSRGSSANDELHDVIPNFNNNARFRKRKRGNPKRHSDSGSNGDCEEYDCSENAVRKRGRTVYKTRKTLDKCHSKNHDQVTYTNNHLKDKLDTDKIHFDEKKHVQESRGHTKRNRKKLRVRKNNSTQNRAIPSEEQESIDKLSRDLTNTTMDDNVGEYVGDTSDDFADDSFSSSDEQPEIPFHLMRRRITRTPPNTPLFRESSTASPCSCSRSNCKLEHVNDIVQNLESQKRNLWELKEYRHVCEGDTTSKVLAWAWSCVEK